MAIINDEIEHSSYEDLEESYPNHFDLNDNNYLSSNSQHTKELNDNEKIILLILIKKITSEMTMKKKYQKSRSRAC